MELIDRSAAAAQAPTLKTERVPMPSLGGVVIVNGRMLADTLAMAGGHVALLEPREGESKEQAQVRAGAEIVADTLARQVVLGDGLPMWTAQQWLIHGGNHPDEVMQLHAAAQRINGGTPEDVEKN